MMRDVLIIGAGIGGLAAAAAFAQRGWAVTVLEQAEAIREVGAGIQVSPNGFRVLDALGLGQVLAAQCPRARAVVLRDHRAGRSVVRLGMDRDGARRADRHADRDGTRDRDGHPDGAGPGYYFVHRADLVAELARAAEAAGVSIRLGQQVVSVAAQRVTCADGARLQAGLIVGADGLHSVMRPVLNGAGTPQFTGQVAWRAVVPNVVEHPSEAWVHMGPGRHLVSYPLRDGAEVNLVAVEERDSWAAEGWAHVDDPGNLRAAFAGFGGAARDLLAAVETPWVWGLFRHPVAARWHQDAMALLGDAAHPTLPFLAQGANMALEDAWVLARCADGGGGLARYQALRRDRVVRVIEAANGNAWKYHLRNPVIRGAAHLGLGVLGRLAPQRLVGQFDWLYDHDVTKGA